MLICGGAKCSCECLWVATYRLRVRGRWGSCLRAPGVRCSARWAEPAASRPPSEPDHVRSVGTLRSRYLLRRWQTATWSHTEAHKVYNSKPLLVGTFDHAMFIIWVTGSSQWSSFCLQKVICIFFRFSLSQSFIPEMKQVSFKFTVFLKMFYFGGLGVGCCFCLFYLSRLPGASTTYSSWKQEPRLMLTLLSYSTFTESCT